MVDPDLHDTFGAHPSWSMPSRRPRHAHTSSGGSGSAADEAGASGSEAMGGAIQNGWRLPMGAPRRGGAAGGAAGGPGAPGALPSAAVAAAAAAASSPAEAAAAAEAEAEVPHVTVYPAHQPAVLLSAPPELSPVGTAMMMDPTNIPGQHSITVHDPQVRGLGALWGGEVVARWL